MTSRIVDSEGMSLFRRRATNSGFNDITTIWKIVNEFRRGIFSILLGTYQLRFPGFWLASLRRRRRICQCVDINRLITQYHADT
jgi:hypothetical protein